MSVKSPQLYKSDNIDIINWCGHVAESYNSDKELRLIFMAYFET